MFHKNSSEQQEFHGKEVTDAIKKACETLGVAQEQLDIEIISTGSAGIFGLIRKKAKIRVTVKEIEPGEVTEEVETQSAKETLAPARPSDKTRRDYQDGVVEVTSEHISLIEAEINTILKLMSIRGHVESSNVNGALHCVIKTEDEAGLTDQDGRALDSLQYIIRKIAAKKIAERIRINLDVNNFRKERLDGLKMKAVELAKQVKEDGRTQVITSLNPSERRAIHMILQEDKEIRSRSVGDGLFKKILIYKPGKGNRGGRKRGYNNRKKHHHRPSPDA